MLANYGHDVAGYDTDETVRAELRDGDTHFDEPGLHAFVSQALESDQLEITDEVVPAKYQVICVPTPFEEETKSADLRYIEAVGRAIAPKLRTGDTVILESTVPPGTTTETLQPLIEESGLVAGEDFALAHCPETVLPGNIITELRENNRIVGGLNDVSVESAVRLYESFVDGEIRRTTDPTVAEFVKLIQNTSRDVDIAFANEIAKLAGEHSIDSREAIELANEHPRVDILQPGPGVGGHCLPVDPWFLGADSSNLDLIATARNVNDGMATFVIDILVDELREAVEPKIAVLGVAYKGNVSDSRMSPGLRIARQLAERETNTVAADGGSQQEYEIALQDPHVSDPTLSLTDTETAITNADALLITTDHDEYEELDPARVTDWMDGDLVVDTKDCLDHDRWEGEGFTVRGV